MHSWPVGVAVVGAGVVSVEYLTTLRESESVTVHGVYDAVSQAARDRAREFGVDQFNSLEEVLNSSVVDIVINLTPVVAHADITRAALEHGKDVWSEKPLALTSLEAEDLIATAHRAGRELRCAPDTLLGPSFAEAVRLIRSGAIGVPVSALMALQSPGPDRWHGNPATLYGSGGGPLRDVGPYYLSALLQLLGEVDSVWARAAVVREEREVRVGPRTGDPFDVKEPTNVQFGLSFRSGASAIGVMSWDSPIRRKGVLELTGTAGAMRLGDPNTFAGEVQLLGSDESVSSVSFPDEGFGRGLGVIQWAIEYGRRDMSSADLGLRFLQVVEAIERADRTREVEYVKANPPPND